MALLHHGSRNRRPDALPQWRPVHSYPNSKAGKDRQMPTPISRPIFSRADVQTNEWIWRPRRVTREGRTIGRVQLLDHLRPRTSTDCGIVSPSDFAVFRLVTS